MCKNFDCISQRKGGNSVCAWRNDASDADDARFMGSKYVGAFAFVDSMLPEVLFIVLM